MTTKHIPLDIRLHTLMEAQRRLLTDAENADVLTHVDAALTVLRRKLFPEEHVEEPTFKAGETVWEVQTFDDDPTRVVLARWTLLNDTRADDAAVRVAEVPDRDEHGYAHNYRRIDRLYRDLPVALSVLARHALKSRRVRR